MGNWGGGNTIGCIYRLTKHDTGRVGHCWMRGRLIEGDLALCIAHAGDCFYQYILLDVGGNYIRGVAESRFGSYSFAGEAVEWIPSNRELHLLCAGETIYFKGGVPIKEVTNE